MSTNDQTLTGRSSFTDMEVLIQNLLSVRPSMLERPPWGPDAGTGRLWCASHVASRVMWPLGVPLLCFLSCCRDGRRKRWEAVLSCSHPGCWLSDSGRKTATDPGRGGQSPGSVMTLDPRTLLLMMGLACLRPGNTLLPG